MKCSLNSCCLEAVSAERKGEMWLCRGKNIGVGVSSTVPVLAVALFLLAVCRMIYE